MFNLCSLPLISVLLLCAPVQAADFSGRLRVIDGDTFDIGDVRVRLHGVDAPEKAQTCLKSGREFDCGAQVVQEAKARFEGKRAECETRDIDRYERIVARCSVEGEDIGAALVGAGLAFAYEEYSQDYISLERQAQSEKRGLWDAQVQRPAEFRAAERRAREAKVAEQTAANGCEIKGNISSSGKIYHQPGQRDYARVSINESAGEQWFCSTREAEAAGWRAALR